MSDAGLARVLVVEDEASLRDLYAEILETIGVVVERAATLAEGIARFDAEIVDVVLTDLRLPDGDGTAILTYARAADPDVEVIVITAYGSIPSAVDAMRQGAADYLTKPLGSPDDLRRAMRSALDRVRARRDAREAASRPASGAPVVASSSLREVFRQADAVAPTGASVLILGESGTGKEILARHVHGVHPGEARPFVTVNLAAIPEGLIESELFGHEKGAFTGAVERRVGRFEQAAGGTLFLDEIGELRSDLQAKLLRVLQERQFERLGGGASLSTDARILAATNRDLEAEVRAGRFREDLYYRLAVFPIVVPPLRDRPDDILPLAERFLAEAALRFDRPARVFAPWAADRLVAYAWPGNARELRNVVERAVILSPGPLVGEALVVFHAGLGGEGARDEQVGLLPRLERETILRVLKSLDGNRRRAARVLGISLRTLQYRLKEYGV